jgi:hypothetical protein
MNLVFTKNEDNMNEIFASLRNTAFNENIDEESELESEQESGEQPIEIDDSQKYEEEKDNAMIVS